MSEDTLKAIDNLIKTNVELLSINSKESFANKTQRIEALAKLIQARASIDITL